LKSVKNDVKKNVWKEFDSNVVDTKPISEFYKGEEHFPNEFDDDLMQY
jgi:hypothetical protein